MVAAIEIPRYASGFQKQRDFRSKLPFPVKYQLMAELKTIRLTEQVKAAG
jgi:hypothetical protein